jgi:hypothetical protein
MNSSNLKPDEIRKIIWKLSIERAKIQKRLSSPPQMIEGCIHTVYKKCGNPACRCNTGDKHGPYTAIVRKVDGRVKLTYIDKASAIDKAVAYKKYNKELATLRKINEKIFSWLRRLRDINTTAYEK